MLEIQEEKTGEELVVTVKGQIDTETAPKFSEALAALKGTEKLVLNFKELKFMSSAGIRVLLSAYKKVRNHGSMKLIQVNDSVYEILRTTGLIDKLTVERC